MGQKKWSRYTLVHISADIDNSKKSFIDTLSKQICDKVIIKHPPQSEALQHTTLSYNLFLQRLSIACYAKRCISYRKFCPTVCLTVRHTLVSCQNHLSYDHGVFTGG